MGVGILSEKAKTFTKSCEKTFDSASPSLSRDKGKQLKTTNHLEPPKKKTIDGFHDSDDWQPSPGPSGSQYPEWRNEADKRTQNLSDFEKKAIKMSQVLKVLFLIKNLF